MFKIEKEIPIPSTVTVHGKQSRYPLEELTCGDSFMVPYIDSTPKAAKQALVAAINYYRKKVLKEKGTKIYFATRVYKTGIRCWRI